MYLAPIDYPDLSLIWSPHSLSVDRGEYTCTFTLLKPTDFISKTISDVLRDEEYPSIQGFWHRLAQICDSDQPICICHPRVGVPGRASKVAQIISCIPNPNPVASLTTFHVQIVLKAHGCTATFAMKTGLSIDGAPCVCKGWNS